MKKYLYSAFVLIIGMVFTMFIGGSLGGGDGAVSSGVFNSAMAGLIFAIVFLSATIMLCTLMIIEELKRRS
jgi:hypothetical protein